MSATPTTAIQHLPVPTPSEVIALQSVCGTPAVSVLLSTTPQQVLAREDGTRLGRLLDDAARRLRIEAPDGVASDLVADLQALGAVARGARSRHGIALYAAPGAMPCWYSLPVNVRDRVVVDPTFATRDLVRSLHRTPRHTLLLLSKDQARLFEGADDSLVPVARARFPLDADSFPSMTAFLRAVDSALAAHLRARPSPVVVAGVESLTAAFLQRSRATTRLAGTIPGSHLERPLPELAELTRPVLERYLRSREQESLSALASTPRRRVASGLDAVWLCSRSERPHMLIVEEDLFRPARISEDGDHLLPVDDVEAPDVLDDVVDEVIEAVLRRGGWVALASSGALADHGGIALTVRDR